MNKINFIIIIPARFYSSRFPGKLLADIHGKPMIIRVIEKALTTFADNVLIAVDNIKLKKIIELEYPSSQYKVTVCLTKSVHQSGTERIAEVVKKYNFSNDQIIIHLQGDEPLISSRMIHQVVQTLQTSPNDISVATLATPIYSKTESKNTNVVKVVININNDAIYFSRAVIPWNNINNYNNNKNYSVRLLLRHIGIYAYRSNFPIRYVNWGKSPLEAIEMLEQLRILWNNEKIRVSIIDNVFNISVDTPEALKRVNEVFLINKN